MYIQQLKIAGKQPTMTFKVPSTNILYSNTPPEYRRIIRDMLAGIVDLHQMDHKCVHSLHMKNFVMHKGTVKMYNMTFLPETETGRTNDFRKLAEIIENNICDGLWPAILTRFLRKIVQLISLLQEGTLVKHLAIVECSDRLSFFRNGHALDPQKESLYDTIIDTMVGCHEWAQKYRKYSSREKSERRYDIFTQLFNYENRAQTYVDRAAYIGLKNESFIRWIRNLATHLREVINHSTGKWTADDMVKLSILALHEEQLLRFHDELDQAMLIPNFM
ncbi:aldehyde dehydrogenase X [Striga asiatica]|uniref:Aldehyde dehydrogenase X n=1 Tax=Striga asiatica TaxID=4170 RepID=A0A5A7Q1G6_STRAF|nr:aldehyde dehydrogenase X [Striga asiatica]